MASDLTKLNELFDGLIESLSPQERKKLNHDLSRKIRTSQAKRVKANLNPDGSAFKARKPQNRKGSIKRKMFQRLIRAKWFKAKGTTNQAGVSFEGQLSRMVREHQYGLRGRINKNIEIQYPQRELLGFSEDDMELIENVLIDHLQAL